jgi:hypothetical protein
MHHHVWVNTVTMKIVNKIHTHFGCVVGSIFQVLHVEDEKLVCLKPFTITLDTWSHQLTLNSNVLTHLVKNRLKHAAPWMLTRFKRKGTVPEEQPTAQPAITADPIPAPIETSKKWYQSAKGWADKACRWLRKTK